MFSTLTTEEIQQMIRANNHWFNTRPDPTPCPTCGRPSVLCAMGAPPCMSCTMGWTEEDTTA